ncbi:MAG: hypothetical protein JWQ49_5203 [Edaphobacter sp.]|nr:hypothetical protein [Edaphobacter sp.]
MSERTAVLAPMLKSMPRSRSFAQEARMRTWKRVSVPVNCDPKPKN